jgi:hypothetical protein
MTLGCRRDQQQEDMNHACMDFSHIQDGNFLPQSQDILRLIESSVFPEELLQEGAVGYTEACQDQP